MARYIDADKVIEALQEEFEFEPTLCTEDENKWFKRGIKCAIRNVDRIPTADVEEVKHGKWIEKEEIYGDVYYTCSNCNNDWTTIDGTPQENFMNYCPHCGAKMDGGDSK